ncbi:beta-lactamase family protein [Halobacillus litoralis]|uniref:serine hydrolase domain-containing protein n=1 Tax=Halobacillus litoralis TaxID=45668 RepID=UPI001CD62819|nr:serine hydrolase [Halobacillus litoralis]MCA0969474.1 beta-lactamase family protein [Halobacillus litoralis]
MPLNKVEVEGWLKEPSFSGVLSYRGKEGETFEKSVGYRNQSEHLRNDNKTKFAIASGCKIFTAVAIGQLVDQGQLSFDHKLKECLSIPFPEWDEEITIEHLLTHTSGIPDYFDEEQMDDYGALWREHPVYMMTTPEDFLALFQNDPMKGVPGDSFHYNNAGFIILGLVVEECSGEPFTEYVQKNIFNRAGMSSSGYYRTDALPGNTAVGYVEHDGEVRANCFEVPVKGGPDGGAYINADDMERFWEALLQNKLLSQTTKERMLTPHVEVNEQISYGYGVWMKKKGEEWLKFYVMGYDPGVSFHSAYFTKEEAVLTIASNHSDFPFDLVLSFE